MMDNKFDEKIDKMLREQYGFSSPHEKITGVSRHIRTEETPNLGDDKTISGIDPFTGSAYLGSEEEPELHDAPRSSWIDQFLAVAPKGRGSEAKANPQDDMFEEKFESVTLKFSYREDNIIWFSAPSRAHRRVPGSAIPKYELEEMRYFSSENSDDSDVHGLRVQAYYEGVELKAGGENVPLFVNGELNPIFELVSLYHNSQAMRPIWENSPRKLTQYKDKD